MKRDHKIKLGKNVKEHRRDSYKTKLKNSNSSRRTSDLKTKKLWPQVMQGGTGLNLQCFEGKQTGDKMFFVHGSIEMF